MPNTIYKGYEIVWGRFGTCCGVPQLHKYGVCGYTSERKVMNHIDRLIKQGKINARD